MNTKESRSRCGKQGILDTGTTPSYAPKSTGDGQRGQVAYKTYCESCHGPGGGGGRKGSAITNDSFLALVSDQGLRTIVITGRPELGAPDWRGNWVGQTLYAHVGSELVYLMGSPGPHKPTHPSFPLD